MFRNCYIYILDYYIFIRCELKAKIKAFMFSVWLLYLLSFLVNGIPLVQATSGTFVSEAASPEWVWRWDNPWTLTAYRGDVANSTFFPTPQVFWNGTHWLDYVYEEHEDYYLLRNSHIAVEVYEYYAKFYDVNYSEVRLYDERWEIQRWRPKQGKWDNLGAQSGTPTFTVFTNESGVWLTKSFTSWAGVLNITYTLRVASPLKHAVTWKSFIAEETEFRIIQVWSGIVGGKVKHAQGEENVTASISVNSTWFQFMKLDGTFTILQNLWDTGFLDECGLYRNYVLQPTTIDVHAQGMKADFTFQNSTLYTILKDGTITLDPTTSTFQSEKEMDGYMVKYGTTHPPTGGPDVRAGYPYIYVGQLKYYSYFYAYRGYVSFMTTTIPNNASILSAKLKLKTSPLGDHSDQDFYVYVMGGSQPIYGDNLEAADWGKGTIVIDTWFTGYYPGDNADVNFTIGADQINKWGRTQFELKSSREGTEPTVDEYVVFHSADSSGNEPRLEVTWQLQTETVGEIEWYYLNASNNRAAIVLWGGDAYGSKVSIWGVYTYYPLGFMDDMDKFIEDLHARGFDILTLKPATTDYDGSQLWVYNATLWLKEKGYQEISLFGFSAGGVVVAYEIQKNYADIWHAAVLASAPVDWKRYTAAIYHSADTASQTKVPVSFITSPDDGVANYSNWPIYKQMQKYYNNTVVHKEWHSWYGGHVPFGYTCRDHNETVVEAVTNWYLKVFDVAIVRVTPFVNITFPTYQQPLEIYVTVKNEGNFSETFNVTAYCNDTVNQNFTKIGTKTVTNLAPGTQQNLTFTWQPYLPGYPDNKTKAWPYSNYTISANATVVPGETDTADNTLTDGTVKVQWPGDASGDGCVDVDDLQILGWNWQKTVPPGEARADFNGDRFIDVDDLQIYGWNQGKGPQDP